MDKQELLKLVDIKKMEEQIALKEKSRDDIKAQIQQQLANIVYCGLYLVVLNDIDPFASKEQLSGQAEKLLAPIAIEDLNGVFVSGLTVVQDNKVLFDQIKAIVSGEMGIEIQYISRIIANRTKFLYLVKVNVAPLKKAIAATTPYAASATNHLTLNLLNDYDYQTRFRQAGVGDAEIREIESEVSAAREVVNSSSAMSTRQQQQIMAEGNANLKKVDDEIAELKNTLANRSRLLKEIIEGKTEVPYNTQDITGCITRALSYFDGKIKELQDQMIAVKEKELIIKEMVNVTSEGEPADDMAKAAVDVCGQIRQSYSKVEQFIRETEVVNYMLTSDKTGSAKDIFRELDKIWLYPVAGERDNFLLTVVARFKISSITASRPSGDDQRWKPSDKLPILQTKFRSQPQSLSADDVKAMLKKYDFYCGKYDFSKKYRNPQGKGFKNHFEVKTIQGDKVVVDAASGLMWQQSGSTDYKGYYSAKDYIAELNKNRFASYSDWRLPTLEEAMTLLEPEQMNEGFYIDRMFDKEQQFIWTSDSEQGESRAAWVVYFSDGYCNWYDVLSYYYVRAVRSGQSSTE